MTKLVLIAATIILGVLSGAANAQTNNVPTKTIDKAMQGEIINTLMAKLNEQYVFPDVAKDAEKKIRANFKKGNYAKITDAKDFAKALTNDLRDIVHDKHLNVRYSGNKPRATPGDTEATRLQEEAFMRFMKRQNLGIPKLDILEGNIGYLKLDGFGPVDKVSKTLSGAMGYLSNTDALIIDLRNNHGGDPQLVQYLVSYFFEGEPIHINDLYFRPNNTTEEFWTIPVEGVKYLDKPVYILTSNKTFSAGEEFSYDMQQLKRGTIVGEVTGGGANPGDFVELTEGFSAFIPNGRAINPITKTNWEGVGVKPDVDIKQEDALKEAHVLALKTVLKNALDEESKKYYSENLEAVLKK